MAEYRITLVVEGQDRASGALGAVGVSLGRIAEFAIGDLLAGGLRRIGDMIGCFVTNTWNAAASIQGMTVALETLSARELMRGDVAEKTTQRIIGLTGKEQATLEKTIDARDRLTASIGLQEVTLAEAAKKKNESEAHYQARLVDMRAALAKNQETLADYVNTIDALNKKETESVSVSTLVRTAGMTAGEAFYYAHDRAQQLLSSLRDISLASPYEYLNVADMFRSQMAFGLTADSALGLARATLDTASALGLTGAQLDRMSWNLNQALVAGDLTMINMRQLRMVGLDLGDVLMTQLGLTPEQALGKFKSGLLTTQDLVGAFSRYTEKNFGGAAQKMTYTWQGLTSNVKDLLFFAGADLLTPILKNVTGALLPLFDQARGFMEQGIFKKIGVQIGDFASQAIGWLSAKLPLAVGWLSNIWQTVLLPAIMALGDYWSGTLLPAIQSFAGWIGQLISIVAPYVTMVWNWIAEHVSLNDVLIGLGLFLTAIVIPAIGALISSIAPVVGTILGLIAVVSLLRNLWESDWGGIRTTLTAFWEDTAKPALAQLWQWLQVNIPVAIAWLANAWTTVLWPAIQNVAAWITGTLIPILLKIWDWLKVNIPIAIDWLEKAWTTVLWPAIQNVAAWITGTLIPILLKVCDWLQVNIPIAIQVVSDFWNNTLLPAITAVWAFLNDYLFPLWVAYGDFLSAVFSVALTALAGIWQNVLQPALQAVWLFISANILPIFQALVDKVDGPIKTALKWLSDFLKNVLAKAFDAVKDAIRWVTDKFNALTTKINNFKLPDWMTPGSPTPLELGLLGIADAFSSIARVNVPAFAGAGFGGPAAVGGGARASVNMQFYFGPGSVRSDADIYRLAEQINNTMELRGVRQAVG